MLITRARRIFNMRSCIAGVCLWLGIFLPTAIAQTTRNIILPPEIKSLKTLEQNWTDQEADEFYHAPQGSQLMPAKWFRALEQPASESLVTDPAYVLSFGYLPRLKGTSNNPDGLPLGFSYEGKYVGITCAACHTSILKFQDQAWIIDGAPTGGDFERLLVAIVDSLKATSEDPHKFDRFARRVLGTSATESDRQQLRAELTLSYLNRKKYNEMNLSRDARSLYGPGRVDAFGAILNQVTVGFAKESKSAIEANAPVSYPCLWDAPQHDRVQWSGAAENRVNPLMEPIVGTKHIGALGRNIGEVLGVFGDLDASDEGSILQLKGYKSSANKQSLIRIEDSLRSLWSPKWPEGTWPIDQNMATKGKLLYERDCRVCHDDLTFKRDDPNRFVEAQMHDVKTDPQFYLNFIQPSKTGVLKGRAIGFSPSERFGDVAPRRLMLKHMVQRAMFFRDSPLPIGIPNAMEYLETNSVDSEYEIFADIKIGDLTISGAFDSISIEEGVADLSASKLVDFVEKEGSKIKGELKSTFKERFPSLLSRLAKTDLLKKDGEAPNDGEAQDNVGFMYKARPLNGVWATAPYLHNGSVLNLDELLKPAAKRMKTFRLGSGQFDPVNVGLKDEGYFIFDTTVIGNSNRGHDSFYTREYTSEERVALIEYIKTL
jgi:hypothetical protein